MKIKKKKKKKKLIIIKLLNIIIYNYKLNDLIFI